MPNYAVGHNMAGYMPEADVWVTDDLETAKQSLIDDLDRWADGVAMGPEDDRDADLDEIDEAIEEIKTWTGEGLVYINYRSGLMAYWINETDEEPEDD